MFVNPQTSEGNNQARIISNMAAPILRVNFGFSFRLFYTICMFFLGSRFYQRDFVRMEWVIPWL